MSKVNITHLIPAADCVTLSITLLSYSALENLKHSLILPRVGLN